MMKHKWIFVLGLMALLSIAIIPAQAQNEIILTIAVPEFNEEIFRQAADQFEAQHPGVKIYLEAYSGFGSPITAGASTESYLDEFEALVSSADVVPVDNNLLPEATRAGYLLDLAPLVNSDPALNSADFYQSMWQSFQWDGGIWGIPAAGQVMALYYNPQAFDEAGVPYPNENWTVSDFESAVRALTQYNDDGTVAVPGFLNFSGGLSGLFVSLLGSDVVDDSVFPGVPNYDNASLEDMMAIWAKLEADGVVTLPADEEFNIDDVPMMAGGSFLAGGGLVALGGNDAQEPAAQRLPATFPGGRTVVQANGYAISSGTQNPELAYELVKFLTSSPEVTNAFFGDTPARRSLVGVQPDQQGPGGFIFGQGTSPEIEAFNQSELDSAVSVAETRFLNQIETAITNMNRNNIDAAAALDELEVTVLSSLQVADERKATTQIIVALPPAVTAQAQGEIVLNFGLAGFVLDADQWQDAADEFAAQDAEVGAIVVDSSFGPGGTNLTNLSESYDCFYQGTNIVPNADLSLLRSLDPLMSTDPLFDPNGLVTGTLAQLQLNGQTWGYPLTLQPLVMRFNPDLFAQAGAVSPAGSWSVAEFEDALRTLSSFLGAEEAAFQPQAFDNAYLLNLIASYGGLPIDTRTNPPTYNFTDPATVEAIRQVLNLAVDGYMDYSDLAQLGNFTFTVGGGDGEVALYTQTLNGFGLGGGLVFAGGGGADLPENTDLLTTFPAGNQFNAVSYDLGTAYISALTPYTEACYRFISSLSQNPEIFPSMPVRRSLIDSPDLANAQGQNAVDFYRVLDNLLNQPNTIVLPTFGGQGGANLSSFWLNRVFDQYVAGEILDLETALAEAEAYTLAFQECTANIPPFDPGAGVSPQQFFGQIRTCAVQIDPSAASFFPNFGN